MQVSDEILEKLQKLIALNERPGSVGEAANSATMINKLLMKYNLSMTDVTNHKPKEENNIIYLQGKYSDYQTQYDGGFVKSLMGTVSVFNFCKMINIRAYDEKGKNKNFGFTVLGSKVNLDVCMYMFDYCLNNIKLLFDKHYVDMEIPYSKGTGKFYVYRRGFYEGAVIAIHNRLAIQRNEETEKYEPKPNKQRPHNEDIPEDEDFENENEMEEDDEMNETEKEQLHQNELEAASNTENALMVLLKKTQEQLDEAAEKLNGKLFEDLKDGRNTAGSRDKYAKHFGYKAGETLDLHKGLNDDSATRMGQILINN
jgi:hypothetical protein